MAPPTVGIEIMFLKPAAGNEFVRLVMRRFFRKRRCVDARIDFAGVCSGCCTNVDLSFNESEFEGDEALEIV